MFTALEHSFDLLCKSAVGPPFKKLTSHPLCSLSLSQMKSSSGSESSWSGRYNTCASLGRTANADGRSWSRLWLRLRAETGSWRKSCRGSEPTWRKWSGCRVRWLSCRQPVRRGKRSSWGYERDWSRNWRASEHNRYGQKLFWLVVDVRWSNVPFCPDMSSFM